MLPVTGVCQTLHHTLLKCIGNQKNDNENTEKLFLLFQNKNT